MESWSAKVFAIISLFAVVLIFGLLPIKLISIFRGSRDPQPGKRSRGETIIDALNCFGGGVFLATGLLHLLPDVRGSIESILNQKHQSIDYPLAEFIACMGFFVVMFLEHLIVQCHRKQPSSHEEGSDAEQETRSFLQSLNGSVKNGYGAVSLGNGGETAEKSVDVFSKVKVMSVPGGEEEEEEDLAKNCRISIDSGVDHMAHTSVESHSPLPANDHHRDDDDVHALRSLVFLAALSTHTIFEGLALGLQPSAQQVLTLLVAVLIHKAIISFTVGVRFAESMHNIRRTVIALLVLSVMAPAGVAIGTLVTETGQHSMATDVASAVLQGMATGTFIYVTFFEVLLDQMKDDHNVLKVLAVIVGFSCIAVLELIPAEGPR